MHGAQMKLLLIEDNLGDARLVREMLKDAEGLAFEIQCAGSLLEALEALARGNFDVALTDLSLPDCQGLEVFNAIQAHAPDLPIVVLTGLDSESAALSAVKSGAQDYLVKGKLDGSSLARALRYAVVRQTKSAQHGDTESQKATIFGMLSSNGGAGTTTIACHFALELKRQTQQGVLLLNLDTSSAGAAFLLKANSPYSISDVASSLNRLDSRLWNGVVSSIEGIDFVLPPGALRFGDDLNGERVRHVLRFVRPLYRWIVVDLGQLDALSMNLLPELRDLFVITGYELPALYQAGRVLKKVLELGMPQNLVHLLLNRAPKNKMVSTQDLEKALGFPVHAVLDDCSEELADAYSEGRFLDRGLSIHKQAAELVSRSLGESKQKDVPQRTWLRHLWFERA